MHIRACVPIRARARKCALVHTSVRAYMRPCARVCASARVRVCVLILRERLWHTPRIISGGLLYLTSLPFFFIALRHALEYGRASGQEGRCGGKGMQEGTYAHACAPYRDGDDGCMSGRWFAVHLYLPDIVRTHTHACARARTHTRREARKYASTQARKQG